MNGRWAARGLELLPRCCSDLNFDHPSGGPAVVKFAGCSWTGATDRPPGHSYEQATPRPQQDIDGNLAALVAGERPTWLPLQIGRGAAQDLDQQRNRYQRRFADV